MSTCDDALVGTWSPHKHLWDNIELRALPMGVVCGPPSPSMMVLYQIEVLPPRSFGIQSDLLVLVAGPVEVGNPLL